MREESLRRFRAKSLFFELKRAVFVPAPLCSQNSLVKYGILARARIPYFTREFWLHNGAGTKTARLSSKNKLLARNLLRLSSRMPLQVPVKGISGWAKIHYFTRNFGEN